MNRLHRDAWYTAACCIWSIGIAFVIGWAFYLAGLQNGFTFFCLNGAIDLATIFAITRVHVPFLTRAMSWVLLSAIVCNIAGWLDYRFHGSAEWFSRGMDVIVALQVLVFLGADIGLRRLDGHSAGFLNRLRSRIPKSHK